MKIRPFRPLVLPAIMLGIIAVIATLLPSFKAFDNAIIGVINASPDSWRDAMLLIAIIGDPLPLVFVALAVAAWELYRRQYIRSFVMAASLIAMPAFFIVKETVERARPVTEYVAQHGLNDFSFPSGHATGTMAIYGMIAFLAYSHLRGTLRVAVVGLCAIVVVLVSFTRVYLGAHFPTDVFAGWLLAFVIISLLRTLSLYLARRNNAPGSSAITDTTESSETLTK